MQENVDGSVSNILLILLQGPVPALGSKEIADSLLGTRSLGRSLGPTSRHVGSNRWSFFLIFFLVFLIFFFLLLLSAQLIHLFLFKFNLINPLSHSPLPLKLNLSIMLFII